MPTRFEVFFLEWWRGSPLGVKGKHRDAKTSTKACFFVAFYGSDRGNVLFRYLAFAKNKVYEAR
jgi:hypothetical protein